MQSSRSASSSLVLTSFIVASLLMFGLWAVWTSIQQDSNFWLVRWMPIAILAIACVRFPWNSRWSFNIDAVGTWLIVLALIAISCTFVWAEPLLISITALLVSWAVSRGLYTGNVRPLCGIWLPILMPLLLLGGADLQLSRWHDQFTGRYTQILLDSAALPNNGVTLLPANDESFVYDLSPSGCTAWSWGTWVGISLMIAAAFGRRLIPTLFLAASAYLLGVGSSLLLNVLPGFTDRFLEEPWQLMPPPDGGSPHFLYFALSYIAILLVTLSADQFWRFVFSKVEPDQDTSSMVLAVSRIWNRLMSYELSTRRMRLVSSQSIENPVAAVLLVLVAILTIVAVPRFWASAIPMDLAMPQIDESSWTIAGDDAKMIQWSDEKRYPGSRQGDRSWIWVTSIQDREVVFRLDYSASSQTDVASQMRLLKWRSIDPLSAEKPAVWDWDRATQQRVRVVVQALPLPQEANTTGLVTRDLIGHFPNWQGNCLFDPRLDGALQRRPLTAWAFTEYMGELPSDFSEQLQIQFKSFVEAMTGTKSL